MSNLNRRALQPSSEVSSEGAVQSALRRLALPLVLAAALVHGLLYVFLVPPWQGPDEHAHFTYVALLDRYDFDADKVHNLDWQAGNSNEKLIEALSASMTQYNFNKYKVVHDEPPPPVVPASLGTSYRWQFRQPPTYYWLCVAAIRGLRAMGAGVDPFANPAGALMAMRGVSLVLNLGVVALAWAAGALLSAPHRYRLSLLVPLTVSLLPMHTFVAAIGNNDILAELVVSALFVSLIALLKWPTGVRGALLAVCAVLLAGASAFAKSTALAAAVPMLGLGLLAWLGLLLTRALLRRCPPGRERVVRVGLPIGLGLLTVLSAVILSAVAFVPEAATAGWRLGFALLQPAPQVASADAHDGRYLLELQRGQTRSPVQMLLPPVQHPQLAVTLSGWARLAPGQPNPASAGGTPPKASLNIDNIRTSIASGEAQLASPGAWVPLVVTATVPEGRSWVLFRLAADTGAGAVQFDDLKLNVESVSGPWSNSTFSPTLLNPSFEQGHLKLRDSLSRFVPLDIRQILDVLVNPQRFDTLTVWRGYTEPQYRSFWGNFGWLTMPLPDWLYRVLALLSLLALLGLLWLGARRAGTWGWREWLGVVSLFGLGTAIIAGFTKQTMFLSAEGGLAYPQGRYLFVLTVPIAWLLVSGLAEVVALTGSVWRMVLRQFGPAKSLATGRASGLVSGGATKAPAHSGVSSQDAGRDTEAANWVVWVWISGLALFAAYCLLVLVVPFYSA